MLSKKISKLFRKNVLLTFFIILSLFILYQYYHLQVIQHTHFSKQAGDNIFREISIPAPRGIIYDRNGIPLVDNKPLYNLKIIPSEIDSQFNYLYLNSLIDKNKYHIDSVLSVSHHIPGGHLKPILLERYINDTIKAKFEENKLEFQGLHFFEIPARTYISDCNLSHILGYLSLSKPEDIKIGYSSEDMVGISGVEKYYELMLKGSKGVQFFLVDSRGIIKDTIVNKNSLLPVAGQDVYLTIDSRIQYKVESVLNSSANNNKYDIGEKFVDNKNGKYDIGEDFEDVVNGVWDEGEKFIDSNGNFLYDEGEEFEDRTNGKWDIGEYFVDGNKKYDKGEKYDDAIKGSIIIMNPEDGEIYALASYPDYPLELFKGGINQKTLNIVESNSSYTPLFNRAIKGKYPPGSIFKLLIAIVALKNDLTDNLTVNCNGNYVYSKFSSPKKCWKENGHGIVDLNIAISESCNYYFYNLFEKMIIDELVDKTDSSKVYKTVNKNNLDNFYSEASKYGFNDYIDIDLPDKGSCVIPDYSYLDKNKKVSLSTILNLAIGQGDIKVTPLHVIQFINIIANNGVTKTPHINKNRYTIDEIRILDDLNWEIIQNSMYDAVNSLYGTAKNAKLNNPIYKVYGKTGTAEKTNQSPDAWFAGWLEINNNKKYSICIIIENGGVGSNIPSKMAKEIFDFIVEIEENE